MFLKKILNALSLYFVNSIFKYFTFSKIIGAQFLSFAPAAILLPSAMIFSSFGWISLLITSVIRLVFFGYASALLAFAAPLGAYFYYKFRLARFLLPIICMILFIWHPTGFAAYNYAMLWLIPLVLAINKNNFSLCVGTSFAAHAVGSVVWLYLFPALSSVVWSGLLYLVIVERIIIAAGIYCIGYYNSYNRYVSGYAGHKPKIQIQIGV
jgi:hypothetical protein